MIAAAVPTARSRRGNRDGGRHCSRYDASPDPTGDLGGGPSGSGNRSVIGGKGEDTEKELNQCRAVSMRAAAANAAVAPRANTVPVMRSR